MQHEQVDIVSDGVTLRGWLFLPEQPHKESVPVIVMAHGFAAVKEQYLAHFAEVFVQAGLAALVFDYRNFGTSDGEPRQESDPWAQIRDYRNVISYAQTRKELDADRIGIWGTSYSGGHVLVLGAIDKRIQCVVAQVPTISGYQGWLRRMQPDQITRMNEAFVIDHERVYAGGSPALGPVIPETAGGQGRYGSPDAVAFFSRPESRPATWHNAITLRSNEMARDYEPGSYIARISPTPLLMIVSDSDTVTFTDLALHAYEQALEPKRLVLLPGEHFTPYIGTFAEASAAAREWFLTHLMPMSVGKTIT